mmetsp:Transcript_3477/g.3037  ORF Transcript_3477/g.3037 Transcript_3477/m.3037 type:complete len:100 (+) Transcript_3477:55-354(+)
MKQFYKLYTKGLTLSYHRLMDFYAYILKILLLDQNREDYMRFLNEVPCKEKIEKYCTPTEEELKIDPDTFLFSENHQLPPKPKDLFKPEEGKQQEGTTK